MNKIPKNKDEKLEEEQAFYGVSATIVNDIISALEEEDSDKVYNITESLHSADVADLIGSLKSSLRIKYIEIIRRYINPEVLAYLDDEVKKQVLQQLDAVGIASLIEELDSDDALQLIEDLDYELQKNILKALSPSDRAMLEEGLTYPEDSAGRLMQREMVCIPTFWTIKEVIDFIRESANVPENFHNIYVVDPKYRPLGHIPVNKVLREHPSTHISEILHPEDKTIPVTMDQEEVAHIFKHYGLVSAPVIDDNGRIIGVITVDDIVEIIEEEAEEDIFHLAGVKESDFSATIFKTVYWRIRWLFVGLLSSLLAARVISEFEGTLQQKIYLSFLMVIVASMAGNTGMQTVTVTIRAIATRELKPGYSWKTILKEFQVSSFIGLFFAIIIGSIAAIWLDSSVAYVLGAALFFNIVLSSLTGTCLPIFIDRLGLDRSL